MRSGPDPAFAALCDRMRAGLMTRADVDTINKKCLASPAAPLVLPETGADSFCPMIVATNALRVQVTKSSMRLCARQLPETKTPVRHYLTVRIGRGSGVRVDWRAVAAEVEALPPSRTCKRDMMLETFDGALLMMYYNVGTEAWAANGRLVRMLCVHYPAARRYRTSP